MKNLSIPTLTKWTLVINSDASGIDMTQDASRRFIVHTSDYAFRKLVASCLLIRNASVLPEINSEALTVDSIPLNFYTAIVGGSYYVKRRSRLSKVP